MQTICRTQYSFKFKRFRCNVENTDGAEDDVSISEIYRDEKFISTLKTSILSKFF